MVRQAASWSRRIAALTVVVSLAAWPSPAAAGRTEQVRFASGEIELAGTLHLPTGARPAPGIVLIHGSGEEDRGALRHFATLLSSNGFAALAYDKRGVGRSEGDPDAWRRFSFTDLAADAERLKREIR